jgi:hypothetical protein
MHSFVWFFKSFAHYELNSPCLKLLIHVIVLMQFEEGDDAPSVMKRENQVLHNLKILKPR